MYLVKRCCDPTLPEIAEYFGTNGYATVSWNCRVVESKTAKEMKFKGDYEAFLLVLVPCSSSPSLVLSSYDPPTSRSKNGFRKCAINDDMIVGDTGTPLLPSLPVVIERANKG